VKATLPDYIAAGYRCDRDVHSSVRYLLLLEFRCYINTLHAVYLLTF